MLVLGVIELAELPPVAPVYHFKLVPVAVNGTAVAPMHNGRGDTTVGAVGKAFTVKVAVCVQPFEFL